MSTTPTTLGTTLTALYDGLALPSPVGGTVTIQLIGELPHTTSPASLLTSSNVTDEPGGSSRSKRFEGSEHCFLGESITLQTGDGVASLSGSDGLKAFGSPSNFKDGYDEKGPPITLSYGQIVALAGDFYGVPESPICTSGFAGFLLAYQTLLYCNIGELVAILQIMKIEVAAVEAAMAAGTSVSAAIHAIANNSTVRWNEATKTGTPTVSWQMYTKPISDEDLVLYLLPPLGRYLKLANNNIDHFGTNALTCYLLGHILAAQKAAAAKSVDDLKDAYAMNAFADHFLTDLFAAGHLRTPRASLNTSTAGRLPYQQLNARNMHGEDNTWGLCVQNNNGDKWRCFGDSMFFSEKNMANAAMALVAIQASADDIYAAYQAKSVPVSFSVTKYIPYFNQEMDYVPSETDRVNFSPLFVVHSPMRQRKEINDLNLYKWSSWFSYSNYDYFDNPAKYNPAPPQNYPTPPQAKPTSVVMAPGTVDDTLWQNGNQVRYALIFIWNFEVFPAANQSSDFGPWSDWVDIDETQCGAICLDNLFPSRASKTDNSQTYLQLLSNGNFVGWSYVRQIKDKAGAVYPYSRLCGEGSPGQVRALAAKYAFQPYTTLSGSTTVYYLLDSLGQYTTTTRVAPSSAHA